MMIAKNTVVKLDKWANETPFNLRESDTYGLVRAITPYVVNGKEYDSYTLGIIEETEDGYRIRPCGCDYYVPAYLVTEIIGQWDPSKRIIE